MNYYVVVNGFLAVANLIFVIVLVRQKMALLKDLDSARADKDYCGEALADALLDLKRMKAKYDEWEQQILTDHQRELDALRAKHLDEFAAQKAETETYMEAAKRLKAELDAMPPTVKSPDTIRD